MDYSSSRERRRSAAASRRAARSSDNTNINNGISNNNNSSFNNTDEEPIHQQHNYSRIKKTPPRYNNNNNKRQPLEASFLSSLSRALTNIDRHNNDYFSSSSDTANNHNTNNNGTMDNHRDQDNVSIAINKTYTPKQPKQLIRPPTTFKSYINFTTLTIYSLLLFTSCYLLLLFCTLPMISYSNIDTLPTDDDANNNNNYHQHVQKGASFQRIRGRRQYQHIKQQLGTLKDRAVQWEELAKVSAQHEAEELQERERSLLDKMTIGKRSNREDVMRVSQLLDEVVEEFEGEVVEEQNHHEAGLGGSRGHDEHWVQSLEAWDQAVGIEHTNDEGEDDDDEVDAMDNGDGNGNKRPGFIVLGMHRSGTSMLSGLLVEGFGYETGGPLIMPNFDNEKVRYAHSFIGNIL